MAKRLLLPLGLALILSIRLALLVPAVSRPERSLLTDSQGYLDLAEGLRTRGVFEAPAFVESIRTPGYPVFLAIVQSVTGREVAPVIVVQVLLSIAVAGMVYLTGAQAAGPSVGWAGAFLWALNPNGLFWSFTIMSESLFAFLLAGSLLLVVLALRRDSLGMYGLGGLALGLATLVRPIGIYLIPCWFVVLLLEGLRRHGLRRGWRAAAVLGLVAYGLVFAWAARNYMAHGEFFFSKTTGVTLRSYMLARALADARGVSRSEAAQVMSDSTDLAVLARQIFSESPWSYPRVIAAGIARTALGTEVDTWLFLFGLRGTGQGLLTSLLKGDVAEAMAAVARLFAPRALALSGWLLLWGGLYAIGAWLAAIVGWIRKHANLDSTGATAHWLAALSAIYLVVVPLANGDARFRAPVDPLLAFLAGVLWLNWRGLGWRAAVPRRSPAPMPPRFPREGDESP
jgi:4-amino-4-deoxy-L-arabinose transferase-like glycosyltransferase